MSETRATRIDRAIDGAVREMLAAEPRADLAGRVMRRLAASSSPRRSNGFRRPAFAFGLALAGAAVLLLALFVARRGGTVAPRSPVVAQRREIQPPVASASNAPKPSVHAGRPPEQPSANAPVSRSMRTSVSISAPAAIATVGPAPALASGTVFAASIDEDDAAGSVAPLETIAPIAVAPLAPKQIIPADIGVRPLDPITQVRIAPLTPPDRR